MTLKYRVINGQHFTDAIYRHRGSVCSARFKSLLNPVQVRDLITQLRKG